MVNGQSINLIFECMRRNLEIISIMLRYLHVSMLKVQLNDLTEIFHTATRLHFSTTKQLNSFS